MSDALLVQQHERSGRTAIVADEGDSVWLYLTEPHLRAIAADCWLFNRVVAPPTADSEPQLSSYRAQALPPPAPSGMVGPGAVRTSLIDSVHVEWSPDGNAVAAWAEAELIGFITPGRRRGFSRFLLAEGPWGAPLDLELYERSFPAEQG
jgi:hypothetical protein